MQVHRDRSTKLRQGCYWPGGALALLVSGLTLYGGLAFGSWQDGSAAAACLLGAALGLLGTGLALYQDRVVVDPVARTYLAERGFGPFRRRWSGGLSEIRGISVQREARSTNDGHWFEWVVKVEMPDGHRPVQIHGIHDYAWGMGDGRSARAVALEYGATVAGALGLPVIDRESGTERTLSADEAEAVARSMPKISREQALQELRKGHAGAAVVLALFGILMLAMAGFGDRTFFPGVAEEPSPALIVFLIVWNLLLGGGAAGLLYFAWATQKGFRRETSSSEQAGPPG